MDVVDEKVIHKTQPPSTNSCVPPHAEHKFPFQNPPPPFNQFGSVAVEQCKPFKSNNGNGVGGQDNRCIDKKVEELIVGETMPFFYSQYLKDAKPKAGGPLARAKAPATAARPSNTTAQRRPSLGRPSSGRLVWHSNIGASGRRSKGSSSGFKPLKSHLADGAKKVVHFSTIEVQPFHFDWSLADDVFYSRRELTAMGQSRFDDAAKLRKQRHMDEKGGEGHTVDDVDISKRTKNRDIAAQLTAALEDGDRDEHVSIRGIEHFVYPDLQQEMIRRKKEVQREVLAFVRSKRPDPQGWRLAQHSRTFSQWARDVALEKGMKYSLNLAAEDPETAPSKDELERFQKSSDELEATSRSLRGSSSFSAGSHSFDTEDRPSINALKSISEDEVKSAGDCEKKDEEEGDPDESRVAVSQQPAGSSTGED